MSAITTHILDIARGQPAVGVAVRLEIFDGENWRVLGEGTTDEDGRVSDLLADDVALNETTHRLTFAVGDYFAELEIDSFHPRATIEFVVRSTTQHYHVPLLLSPFGYSTYRGS